ncbi:bifunctional phosphatase PAP2/diacylglycerol kinase family protein [Streptomyces sp. NPDC086023]|uniref:bifunctional phosphatase PAP2/diacylglycerol kinase family protein n=1 Tax=Streptomyces sp. NPDC086023 TaxID=3365746 RepID=UPI0037D40924
MRAGAVASNLWDATGPRRPDAHGGPVAWRGAVGRWDRTLFDAVARRHWPGGDLVLPRLSRAANHGMLWAGGATALALFGSPRSRKAALRAMCSLAVASATINTVGKWSVRRPRPLLEGVPAVRHLRTQPETTSFPSGHAASAAAFATGLTLEAPAWGLVAVPLAVAVAASRVYTGVHYPADVLAGAALGVGAGLLVRSLAREGDLARTAPGPERAAEAPALHEGDGLTVVVNSDSGTAADREALVAALPRAEVVVCPGPEVAGALAEAAGRCRVLGVSGGDGTMAAAAAAALAAGVPLAVFPGGTLNHFAADLGIAGAGDTVRALAAGSAVRVAVGRFTPGPDGQGGADGRSGYFLNTFSLGVYPELVWHRERWAPRIGSGPAALLAAWRVLRAERPVRLTVAGRPRSVWLLFAGNGTYHGSGPTPRRRVGLHEELLDVRIVHGGGRPGPRLLAALMTGPLTRSPVHTATRLERLRISDIPPGTLLAYDGEWATAPAECVVDKLPGALTVYRPES